MSVDPSRQWFVYHNETELGPFSEPEMLEKIRSSEFDDTTFVFTDGMSDWELIADTPLAQMVNANVEDNADEQETSVEISQEDPVEMDDMFESGEDVEPHQPTSLFEGEDDTQSFASSKQTPHQEESSEQDTPKETAGPAETTQKSKKPGASKNMKPIFAAIFALLLVAAYFINRSVIDPYVLQLLGQTKSQMIDLTGSENAADENMKKNSEPSIEWAELDAFVKISDPKGAPFKLSSEVLAGFRPIIIGAISPMLELKRMSIAVFPDNETSLYAIPPVWMWNVDVNDGYFSAGPHLYEGGDVKPGRYIVMAASDNRFLGKISFQVGEAFIGDDLKQAKQRQINSVKTLSEKEKNDFLDRFSKVLSHHAQIKKAATLALARKPKRRAWLEQRTVILSELNAILDTQRKITSGPMFYRAEQALLLKLLNTMDSYLETLEFFSYGGAGHVRAKGAQSVDSLKKTLEEQVQKIELALEALKQKTVNIPLSLDESIIKTQVMEESK